MKSRVAAGVLVVIGLTVVIVVFAIPRDESTKQRSDRRIESNAVSSPRQSSADTGPSGPTNPGRSSDAEVSEARDCASLMEVQPEIRAVNIPEPMRSMLGDGEVGLVGMDATGQRLVLSASIQSPVSENRVVSQVFIVDIEEGTSRLVSHARDGSPGDSQSFSPEISADGSTIAFLSTAANLVPGAGSPNVNAFAYDINTAVIDQVSVGIDGAALNNNVRGVSLSGDGSVVVFETAASNIVAGDSNSQPDNDESGNSGNDVFAHDRTTRTTQRVSVRHDGSELESGSHGFGISFDGRYISFGTSESVGLPDEDRYLTGNSNYYAYDRTSGSLRLLDSSEPGWGVSWSTGHMIAYHDEYYSESLAVYAGYPKSDPRRPPEQVLSDWKAGFYDIPVIFEKDMATGAIEYLPIPFSDLSTPAAVPIFGQSRNLRYIAFAHKPIADLETYIGVGPGSIYLFDRVTSKRVLAITGPNGEPISEMRGGRLTTLISDDICTITFQIPSAGWDLPPEVGPPVTYKGGGIYIMSTKPFGS